MPKKQITTIKVLDKNAYINFVLENWTWSGVANDELAAKLIALTIDRAFA
jgi:hypothetical protein